MKWIKKGGEWVLAHPLACSLLLGGAGLAYLYRRKRSPRVGLTRPVDAEVVGQVSKVILYPVKSTRPLLEEQHSVLCDQMGVKTNDKYRVRDRSWMVATASGNAMRQRSLPRLSIIQPSITPDGLYLKLDAPDMPSLTVSTQLTAHNSPTFDVNIWGVHSDAVHCGKEASDWVSKVLGKKDLILAYHHPLMSPRQPNTGGTIFQKAFGDDDKTAFSEAAPIHLLTDVSVKDLISRIDSAETKVTEMNFRPNICITGTTPYDEDNWDRVYIGGKVVLENRILTGRCLVTTVDSEKGVRPERKEPLETLKKYRPTMYGFPCIGLFMNVLKDGEIRVGDTVYATRKNKII